MVIRLSPVYIMNQILTLLHPAVFLSWPLGTKGTKKRWKHLTQSDMSPKYLKCLEGGNVGVVFGQKSADSNGHVLAGIDLDRADVVESFLEVNPHLRDGWLSRGRPDRLLVIIRVKGEYPKSCELFDAGKKPVGEWRVDGCQSIIPPSIHPDTGKPYQLLSAQSPIILSFTDIHWPVGVSLYNFVTLPETSSNNLNTQLLSITEYSESVPQNRTTEPYAESVSEKRNLDLVAPFLVSARGQSNRKMLAMARRVKQLLLKGETWDTRGVFLSWWQCSVSNIDPSTTTDELFMRFKAALENSTGGTDLVSLWHEATDLVAPGTEQLLDDRMRHLAGLCYLLHQQNIPNGRNGFYLSCRVIAGLFEVSPMDAWRWMKCLQNLGLLEIVQNGTKTQTNGKSSEFKYIGVTVAS